MEPDLLQASKTVLYSARNQEDRSNGEIVKLPCYVSIDLMQALAVNAQEEIKQILPIKNERIILDAYEYEIIRQLSNSSCNCKRIYIIPHVGFAKEDLIKIMADDKENGIVSRTLVMSNIPYSPYTLQSRARWIIDNKIVVDFCDDKLSASQCIVTKREEDLSTSSSQWNNLWSSSIENIYDKQNLDLQEPLVLSADLINGVASVLCTHNHIDEEDCNWYHGAWQYLRLLDMVSTPTWHHDFYTKQLREAILLSPNPKALITGTADYSVLAYLINSSKQTNIECEINILDLCSSPLFACKWYAKKSNVSINTYEQNIFEFSELHKDSMDMVVTDAFLTRFTANETRDILNVWAHVLKPGGRVITTVRMHDKTIPARSEEEAIRDFKERAIQGFKRWEPYLNIGISKVADLSETYARKMISNKLGSKDEVLGLIKSCGFNILEQELGNVPGELYPTVYLRLACQKT
jgi:ubiquinone/menaquinone biosynthesis C-methylase UbiE